MDVKTLSIDLGKNVFHVVGLNDRGAVALKRRVTRAQRHAPGRITWRGAWKRTRSLSMRMRQSVSEFSVDPPC